MKVLDDVLEDSLGLGIMDDFGFSEGCVMMGNSVPITIPQGVGLKNGKLLRHHRNRK